MESSQRTVTDDDATESDPESGIHTHRAAAAKQGMLSGRPARSCTGLSEMMRRKLHL